MIRGSMGKGWVDGYGRGKEMEMEIWRNMIWGMQVGKHSDSVGTDAGGNVSLGPLNVQAILSTVEDKVSGSLSSGEAGLALLCRDGFFCGGMGFVFGVYIQSLFAEIMS